VDETAMPVLGTIQSSKLYVLMQNGFKSITLG
jgi:hypothetical protein